MKVELNDDSLPKGTELHIQGLGTLKNGEAVEFDEEAVAAFEAVTGQKASDALKGNANIKLSGAGSGGTTQQKSEKKEGGE
jgi:hypothetical protein